MTSDRAKAYGRVIRTVDDVGRSKLQPDEQAQIRDIADALLFSEDVTDPAAAEALEAIEALAAHLTASDRWSPERATELVDDVRACGPLAAVRS